MFVFMIQLKIVKGEHGVVTASRIDRILPEKLMANLIAESYHKNLVINFLSPSIQNESDVKQAGDLLEQYLSTSLAPNIIIDLERVRLMTSAMIGELVKFKKRCDQEKRNLKICGLTKDVAEVFKVTRLDKVFKIYNDRKKALGRASKLADDGVKLRKSLRD